MDNIVSNVSLRRVFSVISNAVVSGFFFPFFFWREDIFAAWGHSGWRSVSLFKVHRGESLGAQQEWVRTRALTVSSGDGQVDGVKHCAGNLPRWWQARRCRGSRFGDSDPPMRSANTACWGSSSRCLPACRALQCDKSFKATCNFTLRFFIWFIFFPPSSCWDTSTEWDPKWPTGHFWLS